MTLRCDDCARKPDRGGFVPVDRYVARSTRALCLGCLATRRLKGEA